MNEALKDFQKAIRKVRKEYQKRGYEVFWIRNIERGTKGAWHIHIVLNEIGDTASIYSRYGGKAVSGRVKSKTVSFTAKISTSSPVI